MRLRRAVFQRAGQETTDQTTCVPTDSRRISPAIFGLHVEVSVSSVRHRQGTGESSQLRGEGRASGKGEMGMGRRVFGFCAEPMRKAARGAGEELVSPSGLVE